MFSGQAAFGLFAVTVGRAYAYAPIVAPFGQFEGEALAGAGAAFGEVLAGGGDEQAEDGAEAGEGGDFGHQFALVAEDAGAGEFFGVFEGVLHFGAAQGEEVAAFEAAVEQVALVGDEGLGDVVDGAADGDAAQHGAALAAGLGVEGGFDEGEAVSNSKSTASSRSSRA